MGILQNKNLFFCNYWLTYKCNSKCKFCKIWQEDSLKIFSNAKFEQVKRNLYDLKKIGVKYIDFTGGEPLLNKDLPQILSYAKKLGFFVKLSTNGILYPQKWEEIRGLPSRIYFSFDTISKNEYQEIRGVDGFDYLLESINIVKKQKQDYCLFYTVTDENIKNISEIISFAQKNKSTLYIHPCFSYFENKALAKENIKTLKKYFWQPYVRMSLPQLSFHYNGGNNPKKSYCVSGLSTIDIGPDDCLTIPCFHKYIKRVKIDGKLFDIYNSEKWDEYFKDTGRYDFCNHCTIDCYFGLSYSDRLKKYFIKQNLTFFKGLIENYRSH